MKDNKISSYFDFLKHSQNRLGIQLSEMKKMMERFNRKSLTNDFLPSISYFNDYIENSNYFRPSNTSHFLGYTMDFLKKQDALFLSKIRHREDMKIFDEQIFPYQMAFLATHKQEKDIEYIFTTNFRIKNQNNSWSTVIQRTIYLFKDCYRMPIASINSLTDFTSFKNDSKINLVIESQEIGHEKMAIENKCYYPQNTKDILSKREIDVLKLASQGMGSKEIADQLNISVYTINNHRRNMLMRSKCKNILQLVDMAAKNGVL